jgi:hypothetical protein
LLEIADISVYYLPVRYFIVSPKPLFFGTQVGTQVYGSRFMYQKISHLIKNCVPKTGI